MSSEKSFITRCDRCHEHFMILTRLFLPLSRDSAVNFHSHIFLGNYLHFLPSFSSAIKRNIKDNIFLFYSRIVKSPFPVNLYVINKRLRKYLKPIGGSSYLKTKLN